MGVMSSFFKKLRGISLPLKVFTGAVVVALAVIFLVISLLRTSLEEAFESQLNTLLDEKAFQHRVRFSRSIESYYYAAKLLSAQHSAIHYLEEISPPVSDTPIHIKGRLPEWLVSFPSLRPFITPQYAFLFDSSGHMLEYYQGWPVAPPAELISLSKINLLQVTGQTHIVTIKEVPYLLAAEQILNDRQEPLGILLISTPLDESFMITSNGPATGWNLVALIDDKSGRVLSSNSQEMIGRGKNLDALEVHHMFNEPKFLALGGMELNFRFASLVSRGDVDRLAEGVLEKEWAAQLIVAIVYMGPFLIIIYWLTRRILRLTAKVEAFSVDTLGNGVQPSHAVVGDQLDILEQRFHHLTIDIKKRTSQLETANHELEAFAYSVSHDLRAPLRSIDGFSQALEEDYDDQFDQTGHDYLKRVRKAAQRMGTLIDEMLMLSRVSRSEIKESKVNLSPIAESVVQELAQSQPNRHVEVRICEGLNVIGDEGLLRVLMTNLLDNAWKFTSKNDDALIEFGVADGKDRELSDVSSKPVFFVRDNGVGFDRNFAGKIFDAFQRLHRDVDFPGTGVGLATVQRIINRHDGSIWADSEIGKGATFYFSI